MSLPARVAGLLTNPAGEWTAIAAQDADVESIYRGHIAILAAMPAVSILVGLALSGGRYLGTTAITTAVTAALVGYVVALALPLAAAAAIAALAPRFKSDGGVNEALKIVAYALTPFWLSGISYVFVGLSRLVVVGLLYSLYLFFVGSTPIMGTPVQQRVPFTLVAAIVFLALNIAFSWIVRILGLPYYGF